VFCAYLEKFWSGVGVVADSVGTVLDIGKTDPYIGGKIQSVEFYDPKNEMTSVTMSGSEERIRNSVVRIETWANGCFTFYGFVCRSRSLIRNFGRIQFAAKKGKAIHTAAEKRPRLRPKEKVETHSYCATLRRST